MPYVLQIVNGNPSRWKIRPVVKSEANFVTFEFGRRFARIPRIDVAGIYPTSKDAVDARDRAQIAWESAGGKIEDLENAHRDAMASLNAASSCLLGAKVQRRLDATIAAKFGGE